MQKEEAVYTLPDLPYAYDALEPVYVSELLALHHDKHHAAYVKGANTALQALAEVRGKGELGRINQLEKDLAFNLSGHVLHSIFWRNMSGDGGGTPSGALASAIDQSFGSFDGMRQQMIEAGTSVQGSGWAALAFEPLSGRLIVEQVHDHQDNLGQGSVPVLVLDMWEHAFYLQYRNEKAKWAKAFWDVVNWSDVAQRFEKVKSLDLGLGTGG